MDRRKVLVLSDVIDMLCCPHCQAAFSFAEKSLRCANGHVFDVARQGYVNLLPAASPFTGDTAAMIDARARFLSAGHFEPIADGVARAAHAVLGGRPGTVVDLGAGTGYYLARVLETADAASVGLALDVSKHAAKRAAGAHSRIGSVVCDTWGTLPVRTASADLVLNVFAPRNAAEIARVLRAGGGLVVVTPTPEHLGELAPLLGLLGVDERKDERLHESLSPHFRRADTTSVRSSMRLSRDDAVDLAAMGPSAFHLALDAVHERVEALSEPAAVTASVEISVWTPLGQSV